MNLTEIEIPPEIVHKWQEIVNLLAEIAQVPAALIKKIEPPEIVVFVSSESEGNPYSCAVTVPLETDLYSEAVIKTRQPLLTPDALADEVWRSTPDFKLGMLSYLGFPLNWPNGDIFGTICILDNKPNAYSELHQRLLRQFREVVEADLKLLFERPQMEASLAQERNLLRTLIENLPDYIYVKDTDSRFILANTAIIRQLGAATPDEVIGKTDFDFHPPELARQYRADEQAICQSGQPLINHEEPTIHHLTGQMRWLSTTKVPLRDNQGRIVGLVGMNRDITERKQADERLRESEEKFRSLYTNTPAMMHSIDPEGRLMSVSNLWLESLGYERAEVIGRKSVEFLTPASQKYAQEIVLPDFFRTGMCKNVPYQFIKKNGEIMDVLLSAIAEKDAAGKIVRSLAVLVDVTDRKRAEQALRQEKVEREILISELEAKNAELERFIYTVSHDLKSPLITIRGFLGFVEQAALAGNMAQMQADIVRIAKATDKMQQLLDELLELSRIGRLMNPPETVSLRELAQEAMETVAGRLAEREVKVTIAADLPSVYGDHLRLREVLENLLDNAVKYMGYQSNPHIEIGARDNGTEIVFYVRDNGLGIEPRYHQKVFGLFEKLDQQTEGSGVGLAIVKRIVEVHGGRIWIESDGAGQGTTFCFTLPLPPHED
jgi:PAS domain S-box-containing protein